MRSMPYRSWSIVVPMRGATLVRPGTRFSHSAWKVSSFRRGSIGPKPCMPPMSCMPFMCPVFPNASTRSKSSPLVRYVIRDVGARMRGENLRCARPTRLHLATSELRGALLVERGDPFATVLGSDGAHVCLVLLVQSV